MGSYLSQPITEKISADGQNEYISFGSSSMQGWRVSNEVNWFVLLHTRCLLLSLVLQMNNTRFKRGLKGYTGYLSQYSIFLHICISHVFFM